MATADDADDNHETLCRDLVDNGSVPREPNRKGRFRLGCACGVAGHSRRPFLIGIALLDPRPRRKSGCTAIAAPSHPQTMASADASRTPNEHPSWLRGDDTASAALFSAQFPASLPCCVSGTFERGTRMLIHSLICYRVQTSLQTTVRFVRRDRYRTAMSLIHIGHFVGDDIVSAEGFYFCRVMQCG